MVNQTTIHFYPERMIWIGIAVLKVGVLSTLPFLATFDSQAPNFVRLKEKETTAVHYSFSLGLENKTPHLPIPDIQNEMTFSFDPPRPNQLSSNHNLLVRFKKSAQSERVHLPCRLNLEMEGNQLVFSKNQSSFWLELSQVEGERIEGKSWITSLHGEPILAGTFVLPAQESPIRSAHEFKESSPFRILTEAKWMGKDVFKEHIERENLAERLECGSGDFLELREGDWLVWKENRWQISTAPEMEGPIAHIQSNEGKALILEGWDGTEHTRIALNSVVCPPFKTRGEDLFSAIRIRSEKQISCMLEKQCMVLKTGDWVLKNGGRWKILRKKEERDAFLHGKLLGDLFILEQIQHKQGQKLIQGRLFNPGRTQVVAIEMVAQSTRKNNEKGLLKSKSQ